MSEVFGWIIGISLTLFVLWLFDWLGRKRPEDMQAPDEGENK